MIMDNENLHIKLSNREWKKWFSSTLVNAEFNFPAAVGSCSVSNMEFNPMENSIHNWTIYKATLQLCFPKHQHTDMFQEQSASISILLSLIKWEKVIFGSCFIQTNSSVENKMQLTATPGDIIPLEKLISMHVRMQWENRYKSVKIFKVFSCFTRPMEVQGQEWVHNSSNIFQIPMQRNQR